MNHKPTMINKHLKTPGTKCYRFPHQTRVGSITNLEHLLNKIKRIQRVKMPDSMEGFEHIQSKYLDTINSNNYNEVKVVKKVEHKQKRINEDILEVQDQEQFSERPKSSNSTSSRNKFIRMRNGQNYNSEIQLKPQILNAQNIYGGVRKPE